MGKESGNIKRGRTNGFSSDLDDCQDANVRKESRLDMIKRIAESLFLPGEQDDELRFDD